MSLYLSQSLDQGLDQRLNHEQKQLLMRALSLRLLLRSPINEIPTRGMEGVLAADQILKEKNARGVLVGGLAESVWNRRRSEEELASHKDVDVLLLEPTDDFGKFEGGIDWWIPDDIHFDVIKTASGSIENVTKRFWSNGNGCTLRYRINSVVNLAPGLYFGTPDFTTEIRIAELMASVADGLVTIEDGKENFEQALKRKLGIRTKLPAFIPAQMGRDPVAYQHQPSLGYCALRVESVQLYEQTAYNSRH